MSEWSWFAVTTGGVAALVLVAMLATSRRRVPMDTRLTPSERGDDSHTDLVLGDMTEVLSRGLPGSERDQAEILPELQRAGYYGRTALAEYRAVRAVLVFAPLLTAAVVAFLVEPADMLYVALVGVGLAFLGFSLPRLYLSLRAKSRAHETERGLPVFADMLSIALLAGQGLTGALRRVTEQLREAFPRMASELQLVIRQAEMLNLHVAFEQWANRSQLPEVRNLAVILHQSERLGNDVTTALMEYATNLRTGSRQRADAKAQRAAFWMLFPTLLCLWIPAAVVLVGPVYFEFSARRTRAREAVPGNQGGDIIKLLKREDATKGK